jgi:hypothetical protein
MRKEERRSNTAPSDLPNARGATETLLDALAEGAVEPAVLLESVYYATDETLLATIRLLAALDEGSRAKVRDYARSLCGDDLALGLLLELPPTRSSS